MKIQISSLISLLILMALSFPLCAESVTTRKSKSFPEPSSAEIENLALKYVNIVNSSKNLGEYFIRENLAFAPFLNAIPKNRLLKPVENVKYNHADKTFTFSSGEKIQIVSISKGLYRKNGKNVKHDHYETAQQNFLNNGNILQCLMENIIPKAHAEALPEGVTSDENKGWGNGFDYYSREENKIPTIAAHYCKTAYNGTSDFFRAGSFIDRTLGIDADWDRKIAGFLGAKAHNTYSTRQNQKSGQCSAHRERIVNELKAKNLTLKHLDCSNNEIAFNIGGGRLAYSPYLKSSTLDIIPAGGSYHITVPIVVSEPSSMQKIAGRNTYTAALYYSGQKVGFDGWDVKGPVTFLENGTAEEKLAHWDKQTINKNPGPGPASLAVCPAGTPYYNASVLKFVEYKPILDLIQETRICYGCDDEIVNVSWKPTEKAKTDEEAAVE